MCKGEKMKMKSKFLGISASILLAGSILMPAPAKAIFDFPFHEPYLSMYSFDITGAVARAINAAVKYFLGDDTDIEAELVWEGGSFCHKCYGTPTNASADKIKGLAMRFANALAPITRMYEQDKKDYIDQTATKDLAKIRMDELVNETSSLDDLSKDNRMALYRAQYRSIMAMADAMTAKRAYAVLKDVVAAGEGEYSNYGTAVSTVGTKRLLLDELLAVKKRIVAARLRMRAQVLEIENIKLENVSTSPSLN